ncbi:hypothetical protein EBR78_02820 [bacterium]|nr:hypothetical protein [bacterium]
MAMRYILRRTQPEDLAIIRKDVGQLDEQLGKPADGLKRTVGLSISNLEKVNYLLVTKKIGSEWIWICPSVELVAENEPGLFKLMQRFSLPAPAHLAHLETKSST